MKKTRFAACFTAIALTAACGLAACGPAALTDEPLKGTVLADFKDGPADEVYAVDGWTNGDVFNVWWTEKNVTYSDGAMHLFITENPDGNVATNDGYFGGEARSVMHYSYGDFEVSMKPVKKDGTASTFFTYTGPSETVDGNRNPHDEIDIEFLGKDTTHVQFNYFVNGQGGHEYWYDLGFDASEEFHTYGYRWTEDYIVWFVDGKPVYKVEASAENPMPSSPGRITMNYWSGTERAEGWMGKLTDPSPDETADYQWIKTSATGSLTDQDKPTVPDVDDNDKFTGDWSTVENVDLTFTGSDKYTVTKADGVTNITYTAVVGNDYINVRAPITEASADKNWVHLTLKNNAETEVQVRVNLVDDALTGKQNVSGNLRAFMDGEIVRTDLEWGGSFFNIPAGTEAEAEIYFGGTPDSLELMIDSSRNDTTVRGGDISVSAVKFAKQGEIENVEPSIPDENDKLTFNASAGYTVTASEESDAVNVTYEGMKGNSYANINAAIASVATGHNTFSVNIKNNGTEQAFIRFDIMGENEVSTGDAADQKTKACNTNAWAEGHSEVYTDKVYGGSHIYVAAGEEVTFFITYDETMAQGAARLLMIYIDSAKYDDNATHSGDITFSAFTFETRDVQGETPSVPEGEAAELSFTTKGAYNIDPNGTATKSVTVSYTGIGGKTYSNIVADIAALAEGKNTVSIKIKNNGDEAVRLRFDVQGTTKSGNTDACNVSASAAGHGEVYTDTNWGGSYITVAAGEEVTITIKFDGNGEHGTAKNLLIYLDSSTDSEDAHSGNVTLSDFIFSAQN